jgi:hypothetical protein
LSPRPADGDRERLWVTFHSPEQAVRFARTVDKRARQADRYVLIDAETIRPRDGYWAQRNGGVASVIAGERIRVTVTFWIDRKEASAPDAAALTAELQAQVRPFVTPDANIQLETVWRSVCGSLDSHRPAELMTAFGRLCPSARSRRPPRCSAM